MNRIASKRFESWLGIYLLERGLSSDMSTAETKIAPLTSKLQEVKNTLTKLGITLTKGVDLTYEEHQNVESMIAFYDRKVSSIEDEISQAKKMILHPADERGNVDHVITSLDKHPNIARFEVEGDTLKVFTKRLRLHWRLPKINQWGDEEEDLPFHGQRRGYDLGRLVITIDARNRHSHDSDTPRVFNLDYQGCGYHPHPTINDDYHPCFGTWDQQLRDADKSGNLTSYLSGILHMIQFPGDDDDGYVRYDDWNDEKIKANYDPKFMLSRYDRDSSSEEESSNW